MGRATGHSTYRREEIVQAQKLRLDEIRPWLDHAVQEAAHTFGIPVLLRDGYAGLRYVGKVLYNLGDPVAIMQMPPQHLFELFREGIAGAARWRMGGR